MPTQVQRRPGSEVPHHTPVYSVRVMLQGRTTHPLPALQVYQRLALLFKLRPQEEIDAYLERYGTDVCMPWAVPTQQQGPLLVASHTSAGG
jgi:hypothetical protein